MDTGYDVDTLFPLFCVHVFPAIMLFPPPVIVER